MNFSEYLLANNLATKELESEQDKIKAIVHEIFTCINTGGTIWTAGNGGSASTASHFVCDLAKGAAIGAKLRIRAFCLNDNISINTAWANDFSYEVALQRQLELNALQGDIFIAFSGSGNSINIVKALEASRRLKIKSIALLGFGGGAAKDLADKSLIVDSEDMQVVENLHLLLSHWIFKALHNL